NTHAVAHLLHGRARRIYFVPGAHGRFGTAQKASTRVHADLARRLKPIRAKLPVALRDDCCVFAAVSDFAPTPLHQARRFSRCVAISAGWKMTAAASVVRSDRSISMPMLEVPG